MCIDHARWTMRQTLRRAIRGCAALVIVAAFSIAHISHLAAQDTGKGQKSRVHNGTPPPVGPPASKFPPRAPFTAADDAIAAIPGMPDARFWADSASDFAKALPPQRGPWLILSTGGADGAFGAGLLTGLSAAGKRPDYAVVTGVSTGALMAPFIFAGPRSSQ